jgi:hypothetical protein
MGAIATGVVEGTISAASYAATETLAYGRDVSFGDVLSVGLNNGIMAGCMKDIMQSIGLCNCFIAGTLVATETGYVTIENIKSGDLVWAHDPETGETALKPVVQTFRNETTEWIHVTVNGETLTCTPEHLFYSPVKGWTSAVDLRAGDILVMLNGEYVVVEQVQHELLESSETTYNFEVEDYHTYYVGENPVLAHNSCRGNAVKKAWKAEAENVRSGGSGITRVWSPDEQAQLLTKGKVSGYVGHHMKSVKGYPTLAGDASNIQFLTRAEHFRAHSFNWRTITHGFFKYWE